MNNARGVGTLPSALDLDAFISVQIREIERVQKDPEREHDDEKVVFERHIQLETALRVFRS